MSHRIGGIRPGLNPRKVDRDQRLADAARLAKELARLRNENMMLARALVVCTASGFGRESIDELEPAELSERSIGRMLANTVVLNVADGFGTRVGLLPGRVRELIGLHGYPLRQRAPKTDDPDR